MLRFGDCFCGTSTTGTGTLTLAATPVAPGGIDPDVWARATGIGFGNSAAIVVSYSIIEFTDSTFATAKQQERGVGTLTLGSSSGIANATLTRSTILWTATSLNSQPASTTIGGSAISIGIAANTLVMIAPANDDLPAFSPYFNTGGSVDSNWGVSPDGLLADGGANTAGWPTSNTDWYIPFRWSVPMLVKRLTLRVAAYGSSPSGQELYARIYDINSSGQPGTLLYDFTGSSNPVAPSATGNVATVATGNGFKLDPGNYYLDLALTGLTAGTIAFAATQSTTGGGILPPYNPAAGILGVKSGIGCGYATASSATAGAGPNPANTTSWSPVSTTTNLAAAFGLSPT